MHASFEIDYCCSATSVAKYGAISETRYISHGTYTT